MPGILRQSVSRSIHASMPRAMNLIDWNRMPMVITKVRISIASRKVVRKFDRMYLWMVRMLNSLLAMLPKHRLFRHRRTPQVDLAFLHFPPGKQSKEARCDFFMFSAEAQRKALCRVHGPCRTQSGAHGKVCMIKIRGKPETGICGKRGGKLLY